MAVDFEAEGLLDGLDDAEARRARLELLERLAADGVPLEELRRAAAEGRLALLPIERILAREGSYNAHEVAAEAGVGLDFLDSLWRSLGLPAADYDERVYTNEDLEAVRRIKGFLDAGFAPAGVLEGTRLLGQGTSAFVSALYDLASEVLVRQGDTELDVALRWAEAMRVNAPQVDRLVIYVMNVYRRERARQEVVSAADLASGGVPGTRFAVVCFADIVGFTRLGERIPPEQLGAVAGRLSELVAEAAVAPVRLVKTIGDAAMLVCPNADAMLDSALTLLERADAEGEDFPQLRAGVAAGEAVRRAGDWYGRPVNLASRVTGYARRGSVLATADVREAAEGDYRWSAAGRRRFKGVRGEVPLLRVRRAGTSPG